MSGIVQISYQGSHEEPSPFVTIHNPKVLPAACVSQVQRFGLVRPNDRAHLLAGRLKGSRVALTEMIHTYGVSIEVIPATP